MILWPYAHNYSFFLQCRSIIIFKNHTSIHHFNRKNRFFSDDIESKVLDTFLVHELKLMLISLCNPRTWGIELGFMSI